VFSVLCFRCSGLKELENTTNGVLTSAVRGVQGEQVQVTLLGAVLFLRGAEVTAQPLRCDTSSDYLCWNGEVFAGLPVRAVCVETRRPP